MTIALTPSVRDFLGYGRRQRRREWPGGARVAVSVVVNFEEGAEFSISDGDDRNEAIYEMEHRLEDSPHPCLDSHFEYGARAGWWRVMGRPQSARRQGDRQRLRKGRGGLPMLGSRRHRARARGRGARLAVEDFYAGMTEEVERQRIAWTVEAITRATACGRSAGHALGRVAQYAPPLGRGRRLSLRQRRL